MRMDRVFNLRSPRAWPCVILVAGALQVAHGETIPVNAGGSIQAAIDQALSNQDPTDTIRITKGTYVETIRVDYAAGTGVPQEGLKIERKGKGKVLLRGSSGEAICIENSTNVVVRDIDVQSQLDNDNVPAILINPAPGSPAAASTTNLLFINVNGVPGDDRGVLIEESLTETLGIRFEKCDFSGMQGVAFTVNGFGHEFRKCKAGGLNAFVLTGNAQNCWIIGCTAKGLGTASPFGQGVISLDGNGHRVFKTKISGGGEHGLYSVGNGHFIENCTSTGNAEAGFRVVGTEVVLKSCTATGNDNGFEGGGLGASIIGGKFSQNASTGIRISQGGVNLRGATANSNGGDGILVAAGIAGTNIRDCRMKGNAAAGLRVNGVVTWVEGNVAKAGDDLIDGGTNNAGRNNKAKGGGQNDF